MKYVLRIIGRIAYWLAWPAYWVYFRRVPGRTRVVVRRGSQVLMVRQWISSGKWQLPGGGLHAGEEPAIGAARELYEETGVRVEPAQLREVGTGTQRVRGLTFGYYVFAATTTTKLVRRQTIELSDVRWFAVGQLNAGNTTPDALAALRMVQ